MEKDYQVVVKKKRRIIGINIIVLLLLFSSGCRLAYIFHAASGQFRLLHHAIPMEEALKADSLSQEQRDHLLLVARIKAFGEEELGLKKTRNYQTVNLKTQQNPIFTVSASPKDRLERITWWFPVVGKMPYLGFFDLASARDEKEKLLKQDLDVTIGRGIAYSTLGWFEDPVTLNLLEGSTVDLVETILHEMTHTTLYVAGQGEFNEGLAVLVGKEGTFLFFKREYGTLHPLTIQAKKSIADERLFSNFLNSLLLELEHLYKSSMGRQEKLKEREKLFAASINAFSRVKVQLQTDQFTAFGEDGLNNAYLMSVGLYHRHFHLFEAALKRNQNSIKNTLLFFKDLSKKKGNILDGTMEWSDRQPVTTGFKLLS